MHIDIIPPYKAFCYETVPKLENFYFDFVFPESVYHRIMHGETRWKKDVQFLGRVSLDSLA